MREESKAVCELPFPNERLRRTWEDPQGVLPLRCEGGERGELCGVAWVPAQRVVGTGLKVFSTGSGGNFTGWGRKWQVVFLFVGHSGS